MNMKEQQYVCVLAECGSITRAAKELYISQPALSIYINNLEKSLNVKLFERVGKRFILTYAGERYVEKARAMLRLEEEFEEELKDITGNYTGRIRIGVQTRRATWLLPPVVAAYEQEFPNVDVILYEGIQGVLDQKVKNFQIDLLLCNASDVRPDMKSHLMFKEQLLVAVPQRHPVNEKARYVPGDPYRYLDLTHLNGENLILAKPEQSIRQDADRFLAEKGVKPRKVRVISNIETAMQLVAEGLGIGFNREGYARHMKYAKSVNYYGIDNREGKTDFVLAYRKDMPVMGYMQRMIDMLLERGREYQR